MSDLVNIYREYQKLLKNKPIDFDRFNHYAIVHHSSGIEGSTLSENETFILLSENLTPKGQPICFVDMELDHYEALKYTIALSKEKRKITIEEIQKMASLVMKRTGGTTSSIGGDYDSSKGEFRKSGIRVDNRYFMSYQKVPQKMKQLVEDVNNQLKNIDKNSIKEVYRLAFIAHFQMVSIHPFGDGNGRTSRLLMNYIQSYCDTPLTTIFKEDKIDYFNVLEETRKQEDIAIFLSFMEQQAVKFLNREIISIKVQQKEKTQQFNEKKKGKGFSILF